MLINRLIKMYGLRYKYIRIEDQQSNLKINTMAGKSCKERQYLRYSSRTIFSISLFLQETFEDNVLLRTNQLSR